MTISEAMEWGKMSLHTVAAEGEGEAEFSERAKEVLWFPGAVKLSYLLETVLCP